MNLLNKIKDNSNQFLGFELLLFLSTVIGGISCVFFKIIGPFDLLVMLTIATTFFLMGFRLPIKTLNKITYQIVELILVFILPMLFEEHIFLIPQKHIFFIQDLCIVIILRTYQIYNARTAIYTLIAAAVFSIFSYSYLDTPYKIIINSNSPVINFVYFIAVLFSALFLLIIAKETQKKLSIALKQVQQYSMKIEEQAIEIERGRIRRDIHDSIGYSLTAIHLQLENGLKLMEKSQYQKAKEFVITARDLARESLIDMRSIINNINNEDPLELSLEKAIIKLIKDFQKSTAIEPQLSISINKQLPLVIKSTVFRIIQESLNNITRHSKANDVGILLFIKDDKLILIVEDNGIGFVLNDFGDRFGLRGMKERVSNLKGDLEIVTQPGKGCHILVEIPL